MLNPASMMMTTVTMRTMRKKAKAREMLAKARRAVADRAKAAAEAAVGVRGLLGEQVVLTD